MPADTPARARASFDFKRTTFPLVSLVLRTPDVSELQRELHERLGASPDFFDQDLLVLPHFLPWAQRRTPQLEPLQVVVWPDYH